MDFYGSKSILKNGIFRLFSTDTHLLKIVVFLFMLAFFELVAVLNSRKIPFFKNPLVSATKSNMREIFSNKWRVLKTWLNRFFKIMIRCVNIALFLSLMHFWTFRPTNIRLNTKKFGSTSGRSQLSSSPGIVSKNYHVRFMKKRINIIFKYRKPSTRVLV